MTMVDGMRMTYLVGAGPGSTSAPTNSNMFQEFSFSTNIDSAEVGQPGMRINLVPRDGGNQFHATLFAKYTRASWQGDNIDDELRAQGVTAPAKTPKQWDFNPSVGGPIQPRSARGTTSPIRTSARRRCRAGRSTTRIRCRTDTLPIRAGRAAPGFAATASRRG